MDSFSIVVSYNSETRSQNTSDGIQLMECFASSRYFLRSSGDGVVQDAGQCNIAVILSGKAEANLFDWILVLVVYVPRGLEDQSTCETIAVFSAAYFFSRHSVQQIAVRICYGTTQQSLENGVH